MSTSTAEHDSYLVENWDTETLIDFLKEQNLKLYDDDFKILRNEKITGLSFLDMSKDDFKEFGLKIGPATLLIKEAKTFKEKPKRTFSSHKSLNSLYGGNFIQAKNYGTLIVDSLEAIRNEYVVAILHTAINITRDSTGEELSMRPEYEVIGDASTGRVDFAIKKAENLICATEDKPQRNIVEGFAQNIVQLESSFQTNKNKRKRDDDDDFDYLYGIVTTARDWHFLPYTPEKISQGSKLPFSIVFSEDALDKESAEYRTLRDGVKKVLAVVVGLLKDRACVEEEPERKRAISFKK